MFFLYSCFTCIHFTGTTYICILSFFLIFFIYFIFLLSLSIDRYFSNEFWCNLYDSKMIKDMFLSIYNSLLDLTHQQESPPRSASLTPEAHLHKLFRMLFVVFDDVLEMVYKSLTETSYPKFVQSDIGLDLRARLSMGAEARQQFGSKGIDM